MIDVEKIKKAVNDFIKHTKKFFSNLFCTILRIRKYNTATNILQDLGNLEYTEPFIDDTKLDSDILSILENRYEQIMIDKALDLIDIKTFHRLLNEWKDDFEEYRSNYILKLNVVRI